MVSSERIRCTAEGCENTILPETAARTGGYCMRCEGKRKQAERDEYVRLNRRIVDRYAGLSDPVDIIRELHTWRKPDPLVQYMPASWSAVDLYTSLSAEQRERLVNMIVEAKKAGNKGWIEIAAPALATLTDHDLNGLASVWLDHRDYRPAVLFRNANTTIRDRLIHILEFWNEKENGSLAANHALCALAWIGDGVVQARFAIWQKTPPPWRKHLHVGPNGYAHVAGWELRGSERRDLIHRLCFEIIPTTSGESGDLAVTPFVQNATACPWCARPLVKMITIDTTDSRFEFLNWTGDRLEVLTCDACTCFASHIFAVIGSDGTSAWHPANRKPERLPADGATWGNSPWQGVSIRLQARGALYAIEPGVGHPASRVGGHPCWVQDTAYPSCPNCDQTMTFIAQLDNDSFKHHEGSYYAFLCCSCRVTATCYQQT